VEPYIRRCVDSVLAQTYKDFTLVLVDDGSPDRCGEICDEYAKCDSRIQVIHQKNGGLSAARNAGIDWALTLNNIEWLTFIDSDDWVDSHYLEALNNANMSCGTKLSVGLFARTCGENLPKLEEITYDRHRTYDFFLNNNVNAIVSCGKLFHVEDFRCLRFPEGKLHEDEFITYKILFKYPEIAVVNQPIYAYYQNTNSITQQKWSIKRLDALSALEGQVSFFANNGYEEIAKDRLRTWLYVCLDAQKRISECDDLSDDDKKRKICQLKILMKEMLNRYKSYKWISIWNRGVDLNAYANCYRSINLLQKVWQFIKRIGTCRDIRE
jgi:glycosyltransferase involved in cell wall biosynthesis